MLLEVFGKVRDQFVINVLGEEGFGYEGYVPVSSLGDGDYIDFIIDNETGTIVGWKPLDLNNLKE